jgi:excisionase family DNA binding protein
MTSELEMKAVAHQVPRAAQVTGLSRSLLYEFMKRGELAYVKVGRRRLIAHDDLQALIRRHRVEAGTIAPQKSTPNGEVNAARRRGLVPRKACRPNASSPMG